MVAVRNPNSLAHLNRVLSKTDTRRSDIVVLAVREVYSGTGEYSLDSDQIFASNEVALFSKVVALAEKAGKHVELLVVPGTDPALATVKTAQKLQSARLVSGASSRVNPEEQARVVGRAWETLSEPRPALAFEVVLADGRSQYFNLGPHPPRLWPADIDLVHELWLDLSAEEVAGSKLHHRDVVGVALNRMKKDLATARSVEVVVDLKIELAYRDWSADSENESRTVEPR